MAEDTNVPGSNANDVKEKIGDTTDSGSQVVGYNNANLIVNVSDDILNGAKYKKYDNVQQLEGIQLQYQSGTNNIKTINFQQDYVILIRKKLYYAANAPCNSMGEESPQLGDGHYIRTYKVDNYSDLRTSNNVFGRPGSCSFTLKGAERIICYEQGEYISTGIPTIDDMVNEKNTSKYANFGEQDSTNNLGTVKSSTTNSSTNTTSSSSSNIGNRTTTSSDGSIVKTSDNNDGTTNAEVTKSDGTTYTITVPTVSTQTATGKIADGNTGMNVNGLGNQTNTNWKFAEKCDFEPNDEVWIFGKSNFERDSSGDFKMNQIFFGYLDAVNDSFSAGKGGLMMSLSASDQLKVLDLSYVTQNPSATIGASSGGALDLRWGDQDLKHFGTFEVFNPYAVSQYAQAGNANGADDATKQAMAAGSASMILTNVFAGKSIKEIIHQLCNDAGVPLWYTNTRIEPIGFPPFVLMLKQASSNTIFNAEYEKRLDACKKAAEKLMLEFFADESGNIVLKCPNYALGVNSLIANNMGFSQLEGGLLKTIDIKDVNTNQNAKTTANVIEQSDEVKSATGTDSGSDTSLTDKGYTKVADTTTSSTLQSGQVMGTDGVYQKSSDTTSTQNNQMTNARKQYLNAKAESTAISNNGGSLTAVANQLDGVTETETVATSTGSQKSTNGEAAFVKHLVQDGDTLYNLASEYLQDGNRYMEIENSNSNLFSYYGADASELYKLVGETITIYYNNTDSISVLGAKADVADSSAASASAAENGATTSTTTTSSITSAEIEAVDKSFYENTLSELTDSLIPEIPQEYIISFSLTDTDKNIYNMYEVNIETDFGVFDAGGPLTKIQRVFPDINSMVRFGCRPHPGTINLPYMGTKENAHLFAYMMCARSMAERYSGTMVMIEDSYIKVGNPIRFLAYDEHPGKPLSPQDKTNTAASSLDTLASSSGISNLQSSSTSISAFSDKLQKQTSTSGLGDTSSSNVDAIESVVRKNTTSTTTADVASDKSKTSGDVVDSSFKTGSALNVQTGASYVTGNTDNVEKASEAVKNTNAQSIYYVTAIDRTIGISNKVSTMQLTLTCGRMMGCASVIDHSMLLYKTYYDPKSGYCPDMTSIIKLNKKYSGKTEQYDVKSGDTLITIFKRWGDVSPAQKTPQTESEVDKNDPYLVDNITTDSWNEQVKSKQWSRKTSVIEGHIYKVYNSNKSVFHTIQYDLYDDDSSKFVYIEDGQCLEISDMSRTYSDHAQNMTDKLYYSNTSSSSKTQSTQKASGVTYVLSADITDKCITTSHKAENIEELSTTQKMCQELEHTIIALNQDVFGSNLTMTREQFDQLLGQQAGKTITIPTIIDIASNA